MKSLILLAALASVVLAVSYDKKGVAVATDKLYVKECGSCHFAYQPGLLPSNAWQKMMSNLENHFGSDASLAKEDFDSISEYLNKNSAEKFMNYKRSARVVNSLREGEIPDSISKTPYMIEKHKDIRENLITQEEVKGIFNCTACHTTAQKGIYSERDIMIPNYGRWED
ncbi:diheme cytochrome c [Sulfurimonas sp.]|uniref:diheme cytochrome c n=1 Tax=Sulfurimonas sp. TaxID=2022749 RepID=UPI0025E686A4|nr:diheme cytochrome c [Sulfurimonas sp.]MCK9455517.1 diheme cytochrome c [Sulfurimonas sp.]